MDTFLNAPGSSPFYRFSMIISQHLILTRQAEFLPKRPVSCCADWRCCQTRFCLNSLLATEQCDTVARNSCSKISTFGCSLQLLNWIKSPDVASAPSIFVMFRWHNRCLFNPANYATITLSCQLLQFGCVSSHWLKVLWTTTLPVIICSSNKNKTSNSCLLVVCSRKAVQYTTR